jgi:uncharacterized protein (TIGR03067 family)
MKDASQARIQGGSIRLFRVAGIDVLLHWTWFFFLFLRFQADGSDDSFGFRRYHAQVWYAIEYVALFGIVLLHEFGHVLACRSVGGIANRIVLWPLGGIAYVEPPPRPGALLWSIAAGPLVNLLLVAPTFGFRMLSQAAGWQETAPECYHFADSVFRINGFLLLFNLLPIYPLDGGRVLQALLWFVIGRVRSLLVAAAFGFLVDLGILVAAIVQGSVVWGVMAAFGLLFALAGFQGARALIRMLEAPRRAGATCPACEAAPPCGRFWACLRCFAAFDVFAADGKCPNCSKPMADVFCPACSRSRPYREWFPKSGESAPSGVEDVQVASPFASVEQLRTDPASKPTIGQKIFWSAIFATFGLFVCGLPNVEKQPLAPIIWPVCGAMIGFTSAGFLTRTWRSGQARRKLRGAWRLIEESGQVIGDGEPSNRQLILNSASYEERCRDAREVRGLWWADGLAEPPAISFTPKAGPDAGTPRPGIYRIEGGKLTICLGQPGHSRPTAFDDLATAQVVRVYRREGKPRS